MDGYIQEIRKKTRRGDEIRREKNREIEKEDKEERSIWSKFNIGGGA
jgi:hypothetical protein